MLQNSPSWMLQGSCLSLWYDTLHEFGLQWTSNLGKTIISNMTSLTTSLSHRWIFWCHHIFLVGLVFSLYNFGSTLKEILIFDQKYRMKTVDILSVFYYGIVVKISYNNFDICGALLDFVPFAQFKNVKNTHGGVLILVKFYTYGFLT